MSSHHDQQPGDGKDATLRLIVLGAIYALTVVFVVALSPLMGVMQSRLGGEVGRVAAAPEPPAR